MIDLQKKVKKAKEIFLWPEMRTFWLFLIFDIIIFALNVFYLPPFLLLAVAIIIIAAAWLVFLSNYKLGQINRITDVERNELREIVSVLEDALIVYDRDFKILFFNQAAEELFRLKKEMVLNKYFSPRDAEKLETRLLTQVIFPSLAPAMVVVSEVGVYPQIVDLSFPEVPLELRTKTTPVKDSLGNLLAFVKIIHNRTEELELLKSRNEFVTVASHQLRTPINQINWALELLKQDKSLSSESKNLVELLSGSADQLLKIVDSLLDISKIEEGRFGYNFEQTNLLEFIEKIMAEAASQALSAGVKIYLDRPKEELPLVSIDSQKLAMAFGNLLDNAIRYNIQNGEVIVRVEKQKEKPFLEVTVKDTGIGIPPEAIKKLFSKFFRAENAVKLQTSGSGLGLYITKKIIEAHGGEIWVESELNRGTAFRFTIPTDPKLIPKIEKIAY